jgi:hypothetical protein
LQAISGGIFADFFQNMTDVFNHKRRL